MISRDYKILTDEDEIDVVVCFHVIDDVWMVQNVEHLDLLHYCFDRFSAFSFVDDLYSHFNAWIVQVVGFVYLSEGTSAEQLSVFIDAVVHLQLMHALLILALVQLNSHLDLFPYILFLFRSCLYTPHRINSKCPNK